MNNFLTDKRQRKTLAIAIAVSFFLPFIIFSIPVIADEDTGGGSGGEIGCNTSWVLATCYGAKWKWYAMSGTSVSFPYYTSYARDGHVSNCHRGGYWRHAMVAQVSSGNYHGYSVSRGEQVGVIGIGGGEVDFKSEHFGGGMKDRDVSAWNKAHEVYSALHSEDPSTFSAGWNGSSSLALFCGEEEPYVKVEYSAKTEVTKTTDKNGSNISQSGTEGDTPVYSLPKEMSSANVDFKHTAMSNPSGYTGLIQNIKVTSTVDGATVAEQTYGSYGSAITSTVSSDKIGEIKNGNSKKVCQTFYFTPKTAKVDRGTGKFASGSTSGSSTSSKCVIVYRNAYAEYSTSSNVSYNSHVPVSSSQSGTDIGNGGAGKIFADSTTGPNGGNPIVLNFTHTIFRANGIYDNDARFSIAWNLYGHVAGIANTGSESISKNSNSTNPSNTYKIGNSEASGSFNEGISLGTYDKDGGICQELRVPDGGTIQYPGDGSSIAWNSSLASSRACAHIFRPYNFDLIPKTTTPNDSDTNYVGGEITISSEITNNENNDPRQEGTHSWSPKNTQVKVIRFVIDRKAEASNIGDKLKNESEYNSSNICGLFKDRLGNLIKDDPSCTDIFTKNFDTGLETGTVQIGNDSGKEIKDVIPSNVLVGDKICYATAVNYINSSVDSSVQDGKIGYGGENSMNSGRWRISAASCQVTSKRPNFQVWGGSVYGEGEIRGILTTKRDAGTGEYSLFGSWVDFGIVSNSDISYVASGASIANGKNNTKEFNCRLSSEKPDTALTIANSTCDFSSGRGGGNSGISFDTSTVERIINRYGDNTLADHYKDSVVNIDESYTNFKDHLYSERCENENPNCVPALLPQYRYTYLENSNTTIRDNSGRGLDRGITHVIYSTGKITIGSDLKLNTDAQLDNVAAIPQYIIIAKGGINIENGVKRIDAWLVAKDSTINTCAEYNVGERAEGDFNKIISLKGEVCDNALEVNGPVFAKTLLLNRTAGAEINDPAKYAEKFDISAATYFWAHAQAINTDQANTVYTRQLAPRL